MTSNHGGVESFVLNYVKILKNKGIAFDYVDLYGSGLAESEWILSEGSKIYTLQDYRKHPLAAVKRIKQIVTYENYACVHINMLSAASLASVTGALLGGAKVLVHSHNSQALGFHRRLLHNLNAHILRRLPVIRIACGKKAGSWMFGKKQFEVVPNAIDVEKYRFREESRRSLRSKLEIGEDTFVLGFVGRISSQKNPTYLPRILGVLKQRGLENVKLLIVGDGELREEVQKSARDLGVAENILFVGSQKNISEWYSVMDAFLLPSLWEGLPVVGVEAQAAGLPCFFSDKITDEIALTELVQFCELTESAENWAETILNSQKVLVERCSYADRIAQTNYSIHLSAERLEKIYRSVAETRKVSVE